MIKKIQLLGFRWSILADVGEVSLCLSLVIRRKTAAKLNVESSSVNTPSGCCLPSPLKKCHIDLKQQLEERGSHSPPTKIPYNETTPLERLTEEEKNQHPIVLQTLQGRLNKNVTFRLPLMQINGISGCKIDIM